MPKESTIYFVDDTYIESGLCYRADSGAIGRWK